MKYFTGHPASKIATKIRSSLYDAIETINHEWDWSSDLKKENWIRTLEELINKINRES